MTSCELHHTIYTPITELKDRNPRITGSIHAYTPITEWKIGKRKQREKAIRVIVKNVHTHSHLRQRRKRGTQNQSKSEEKREPKQ